MSELFKRFDQEFKHILIHTGQHYDKLLSGVFFNDLKIRKPDFNLRIGSKKNQHYHQLSELNIKFMNLLNKKKLNPDLIVFLGDSNSVCLSIILKKQGYKIAHIEAGMRSYDKRMLEEINRVICDNCSDYLFVYHNDYKKNLLKENIKKNIFVVGNTIVEPCLNLLNKVNKINNLKKNSFIIVDLHRPENFLYKKRLINFINYLKVCKKYFKCKIYFLKFHRTLDELSKLNINLNFIDFIDLQSYKNFLLLQQNSLFIISDSGTAQEEPALFKKPVIVPRDFTERPQSVTNNCSFMLNINKKDKSWNKSINWITKILNSDIKMNYKWLGSGNTSEKITNTIKKLI